MACHFCGQEAIDRCYTCGNLFCAKHGQVNCIHCETGIAAGDKRADRISAVRLRREPDGQRAWWRPQPAEDREIPSCHICQGLARRVCSNCELHYCAEHAGPAFLCRDCGRSSLLGVWCFLGGLAIMAGLVVFGQMVESLGPVQGILLAQMILFYLFCLAGYLIMSLSCRALFRKAGKPGWIGFVPVWNLAVLLQLAGKPSWWVLFYFASIPLLGLPIIILQILVGLALAKNFGKSSEFGIGLGLLGMVFLPILAFSDATYAPGQIRDGETFPHCQK